MTTINTLTNIRQLIEAKGSISIVEFMSEVISSEKYGYYSNNQPFGENGDFITSPEVSQLFGEMIGVWIAASWQDLGSPLDFVLVELGPGTGVLMRDLLRATKHIPDFHTSMQVAFVEKSPALKLKQSELTKEYPNIKFSWHQEFSSIPNKALFLVANEFFDALPIAQYIKIKNDWHERIITTLPENGDLCFSSMPVSTGVQSFLVEEHPNSKDRAIVEISMESIRTIQQISDRIKKYKGAALIIDYGYDSPPEQRVFYNSTLQAIKNHKYHPILDDIGRADISAHVDFFSLKAAANVRGCNEFGAITQNKLLRDLGIEMRANILMGMAASKQRQQIISALNRLLSPEQMGSLFKAIAITHSSLSKPIGF